MTSSGFNFVGRQSASCRKNSYQALYGVVSSAACERAERIGGPGDSSGTRIYTLPLGEPETSATARAAAPAQMSKSPACSLAMLLASTRSTARSRASTLGAMSASGRTSRARPRSARLSRRRMPLWEGAAVPLD